MDKKELETIKAESWDSGWRAGFWVGLALMALAVIIALNL